MLRQGITPSLSAYEMRSISERWMDEAPDLARPVLSQCHVLSRLWLFARAARSGIGSAERLRLA